MSSRIISELYPLLSPILLSARTMHGLPCPYSQTNPVDCERIPLRSKKMLIFCTRKIPLTKEQFLCNHPIQTLFIVAVIAVVLLFLTSDFMYTNIMLIFINRCLLNLIFSMEKALNGQNSSKWDSQPPFHLQCYWENAASIMVCFSL